MAAETIKEFMVSLGWQQNDSQYAKFSSMIEGATLKANLMGAAIEGAAVKIYDSVKEVAESFETLYYSAQRSGASATFIKQFEYAITQLTGSAQEGASAVQALIAMGERAHGNPGLTLLYRQMGFEIDKVTGKMKYSAELAKHFADMGNGIQANAWRVAGGVFDQQQMKALQDLTGMKTFMGQAGDSMNAAGLDPDKTAADAVAFQQKQRQFYNDLGDEYDVLVMKMSKPLTAGLEGLDAWLKAHESGLNKTIDELASSFGVIFDAIANKIPAATHNGKLLSRPHIFGPIHPFNSSAAASADAQLAKSTFTVDNSKKGYVGRFIDWIFGPAGGNAADMPARNAHGSSFEQDSDGFFIPGGSGGAGVLKVNGAAVGPGNPLPVTLDTGGFGSGGDGSSGGGGILGAIGSGIARAFGGGSGGASDNYGSGSSHIAKGAGLDRAVHFKNFMQKTFGLTDEQAVGITGVEGYESGGFTTMQEKGRPPGTGGWGYAQWTGQRRKDFFNWFGKSGIKDPSSVEAQEGFQEFEIKHNPRYMHAIDEIKKTHDVREAAHSWEWWFEGMRPNGPGVPAFPQHMNMASGYWNLPQMHSGYAGGDIHHHTVNVNHKTDVHVDGSMDAESTGRMVGSHIHRANQDLVRDSIGAAQ